MGIHIENIQRGMGLVVLRGPMQQKFAQYGGEMIGQTEDRSLCGKLLGVIATSPPYILVASYGAKLASAEAVEQPSSTLLGISMFFSTRYVEDNKQACMMLDSRRYEFAVASPQIISAILGKPQLKSDAKGKEIGTPTKRDGNGNAIASSAQSTRVYIDEAGMHSSDPDAEVDDDE